MIKKIIYKMLTPLLGKKATFKMWNSLYRLSLRGLNIGGGTSVSDSGELNVLEYVKNRSQNNSLLIFDVGANVGNYSKELIEYYDGIKLQIHCFEPAKKTYATLCNNLKCYNNILLNDFGLSNEITDATLYYDKDNSGLASLYNRQLDYFGIDFNKCETVKLNTLDNYCDFKNITYIDFLKMDIEGNEINALNGAIRMLSGKKIGAIQIEFGGCNIDSRTFIRDFWNILHNNYRFFRILKNGLVEITQYDELLESFSCTNYFFALK